MSMGPDAYAEARLIFHKALQLDKSQRPDFIAQECQGREEIRAELESLLRFHEAEPLATPPQYPAINIAFEATELGSRQNKWRRLIQKKNFRLALLMAIMLVLMGAAKLGRDRLITALNREVAGHLESVLNSNFQAIDLWSAFCFEEAQRWATMLGKQPGLKELLRLSRTADDPEHALKFADAQKEIQKLFEIGLPPSRFSHYVIADDSYRTISCDQICHAVLGKKFAVDADLMTLANRVLNGEQLLGPKRLLGSAFSNEELMALTEYVSWFAVPIRDESERIIGLLALSVEATRGFDKIVKVGRWGTSGETYAFSDHGVMLSESRFHGDLVQAGLLKDNQPSSLNIQLKDPGGNLLKGFRPQSRIEDWPFTRIYVKAMERLRQYSDQMQGHLLEPYRDYRGVEVIGAWRWHPSLHFGLITEVNADEALFTLRLIDTLYLILISLFIAVAIFGAVTYFALIRMRPVARLGSRMGQYRLIRKLTEGGSGEIYLARHEFLKRPTAIKVLKPDQYDPESLRRFEAEVRATSKLTHPNTVVIYDFGHTVENCFYYAMEYLPGISMAKLIEIETRLPAHRAIHLLLQICGSLREAHAHGLIHRDIKPLNIMVCRVGGEYDVVKLVDFGLAKSIKSLVPSESTDSLPSQLRGTPAYMAPELFARPEDATVQSDIYSLGVVAYKMLSGLNLFDAVNEASMLYDVLHTRPRNLQEIRPDLPPALAELIMRCLAKNPMARPASVENLATELESTWPGAIWTRNDARQWWTLRDHLLLVSE